MQEFQINQEICQNCRMRLCNKLEGISKKDVYYNG